ncbi:MAG TPA: glycosyltransferase family 4 protein [Steroidobacteraceae bacterium]|jgi:glycosyltransferase involved in cell wall biosynthesis|nr:glycosyltransferase family 4 protein [Steroidobacteraceae bacterium]
MPKVELISNIFHYYYTALSLQHSGYLGHYITGPSATDDEAWLSGYGKIFRRLWVERRLEGLPPRKIRRIWRAEIVHKSMMKFGSSGEHGNLVHGDLFARKAARLMQECDAVHFVHSVGWVAAREAKRWKARVVCDMREEHPRFQSEILSEEAKHLGIEFMGHSSRYTDRVLEEIDLADHIFCPSTYAKRTFLEQGIREEKLVVCPYGVDPARFASRERPPGRAEFRILFLGRIGMRKGIQYLLEGFRKARLTNARLILAGPVDPSFRGILERYRGSFEEVGAVPHSQVHDQYLAADVLVMPSLADAYPLAVLEAMSTGLPVIVSENTGMAADLVTNGREGFVVPIRDSDKIAEKLTFLHEHRDQCTAMGALGMGAVRALDWANYQRVCASFYDSLFNVPLVGRE